MLLTCLPIRSGPSPLPPGLLPPGLSLQRHTVRSQGYQLGLFRLQGERQGPADTASQGASGSGHASPPVPVMFVHGFSISATVWFILPREEGLSYILYDAGFDVWAPSDRGSTHSQQHDTLSPLQREFWRFTLDDLALNDLPAFVDYVLGATGAQRLATVTWSGGSTQMFMMSSLLSERYGPDRLCAHVALGPVTFPQRIMAPFMVAVLGSGIDKAILRADAELFLPGLLGVVLGPKCSAQLLPGLYVPEAVRAADEATCQLTEALGFGPPIRANDSTLQRYSAFPWPSPVSAEELAQYAQMYRRGPHTPVLLRYNYGYSCLRDRGHDGSCNLKAYGSREPPEYDLGRYGVATTIISGDQDLVSVAWDRENVQQRLPAGVLRGTVEVAGQGHLDFAWADTRPYSQHVIQAIQDACGGGR